MSQVDAVLAHTHTNSQATSGHQILQRQCRCGSYTVGGAECDACHSKRLSLQRSSTGPIETTQVPPLVYEVLSQPGQPLDAATRAIMEPRFGHDFSQVRVHSDAKAAESARAVNAQAYTVGRDVVFGTGQFAPDTSTGRKLLAHELTHFIQQSGQRYSGALMLDAPYHYSEKEAQRMGDNITEQDRLPGKISAMAPAIARQALPGPMSLPAQPPMTMGPTSPSERGLVALSIAIGEVGVREIPRGSNRGACAPGATRGCVDAYTGGRAEPWCAHFVSWAFEQTGFSPFGHLAAVSALRRWGRSQGWYVRRSAVERGEFTPLAGDIFTKPRYEGVGPQRRLVGGHTGFVLRYDPSLKLLETVEGNTGDRVQMRTRSLSELDGFIRVGT